jgi:hypothetical protein
MHVKINLDSDTSGGMSVIAINTLLFVFVCFLKLSTKEGAGSPSWQLFCEGRKTTITFDQLKYPITIKIRMSLNKQQRYQLWMSYLNREPPKNLGEYGISRQRDSRMLT